MSNPELTPTKPIAQPGEICILERGHDGPHELISFVFTRGCIACGDTTGKCKHRHMDLCGTSWKSKR